jgi:phenylacetate-CoA ligase
MTIYARLYANLLMAPACYLRGRKYEADYRFLLRSQWWSRDELQAFQWAELSKLIRLAASSTPYYQELFRRIGLEPGDVKNWDDFRRIPILRREDVVQNKERLASATVPRSGLLSHATGGSSGVPVGFYRTWESYDWRIACTRRAYGWSGHAPGEKSLLLWGAPVGKVPVLAKWRTRVANGLMRSEVIPTFVQNDAVWQAITGRYQAFRPRFLIGYASSLVRFARYVAEKKLRLAAPRAIISAAEGMQAQERKFLSETIGAPVFNTYGSREFMSIGGECEFHSGLHINSENILLEVESPNSSEASPLLVTDLHNAGTVFLRYSIGDVGTLSAERCACGRSLPLLASVQGRVVDTLELENGRKVQGLFFPHILKDIPEILSYQVKQLSPQAVEVRAVLSQEISARSQALFDSEMKKVLGNTEVTLRRVEELETSGSGKVKVVIGLNSKAPTGGQSGEQAPGAGTEEGNNRGAG